MIPTRRTLSVFFAIVVALVCAHVAAAYWERHTTHVVDPVDIQSLSMLAAKLDALDRHDGPSIALLGDSLMYGAALEQYGNARWREENLSGQLHSRLQERGHDNVLVLNLGINGGRPADMLEIVRLLRPHDMDLVIFDVSPRGFSRDFVESDRLGRPWLNELRSSASGQWRLSPRDGSIVSHLSAPLRTVALNAFAPYKLRDIWHWRYFEGTPGAFVDRLTNRLNEHLKGSQLAAVENRMLVLLDVKQRLANADFQPDNPQRVALTQMLAELASTATPALGFYATENPRDLPLIMERERHAEFVLQLREFFARYENDMVQYVSPIHSLPAERYLDYIHVDAKGYTIVLDHLWPDIKGLLFGPSAEESVPLAIEPQ